jgi:anthranilate phosphoribosyltransferase
MFHPALASVGPTRRQLGVKTFFNMLGPLVNPALPNHQSVGVFNLQLARLYQYLHESLDKKYTIIHAIDGYDEISLTGKTKIINNQEEYIASPSHFKLPTYNPSDIFGGDTIESAAKIFLNVLDNNCTQAQKDVVVANSAIAIQCFDQEKDILDCVNEAILSIESGKAKEALNKIRA